MFYKVSEISRMLKTSEETIRRAIREKKITPLNEGARGKSGLKISHTELKKFILQEKNCEGTVTFLGTIDIDEKVKQVSEIITNILKQGKIENSEELDEINDFLEMAFEEIEVTEHKIKELKKNLIIIQKQKSMVENVSMSTKIERNTDKNLTEIVKFLSTGVVSTGVSLLNSKTVKKFSNSQRIKKTETVVSRRNRKGKD